MESSQSPNDVETPGAGKGLEVQDVIAESPGWDAGIRPGDRLISLNNVVLRDLIDLEFYQSDSELLVEYRSGGKRVLVELEKDPDISLGLVVNPPPIKRCPNDCEFCFVDQMPEGARKTLYIRDEDYRYSFLYGNFITLTNLTEKDYQRILDQHLSPLYISIHASPLEIRRRILKNQKAPDVLPLLRRLIEGGIRLQTQIVLTPGVNDGGVLEKTWEDLLAFFPGVESLAVVPVGLTSHRQDLPDVPLIDRNFAREMIGTLLALQKRSIEQVGDPFIYPSDEWYVIADRPFPSVSRYGGLPQLGNGVGLVPLFERQWKRAFRTRKSPLRDPLILLTGTAFAPHLRKLLGMRETAFPESVGEMRVLEIENGYFGPTVSVAGLMSSRDIVAEVRRSEIPSNAVLCVPDVCLKDGTDIFIDDGTLANVRSATGFETVAVPASGKEFWRWVREQSAPVPVGGTT